MASHLVTLAGRYALEETIERGGMATVWQARDEVLARTVAVKLLHPHLAEDDGFIERFRREALAAARLTHPNIVAIYDTGSDRDGAGLEHYFIVMEYCSGGDLASALAGGSQLSSQRVADIGATVLGALTYAHGLEVIHRDIKPANVLVAGDGTLKVADFGIAKAAFTSAEGDVTTTGAILGTVAYISPEQAQGREPDVRSDVYSVGALLYELLVGRPPFTENSAIATAMAHVRKTPPPPRSLRAGVPRWLEVVVLTALAKDPGERYASAGDMQAALESHAMGERTAVFAAPAGAPRTVSTPNDTPPGGISAPGVTPQGVKWVMPVVLIIVVAAALAFGISMLLGNNQTSSDGGGQGPGNGGGKTPAGQPIAVSSVRSFDPASDGGDGSEHPEETSFATDGDPSTAWSTEHYGDANFGELKPGVGLLFDLGSSTQVGRVVIKSPESGYSFDLASSNDEGTARSDYQTIKTVQDASTSASVTVDGTGRYWLLWLTRLPPSNSASISEVSFSG